MPAIEGSMRGRICVVTGATSGIGLVTARELARAGATVALVARDARRAAATATEITATSGNSQVRAWPADLTLRTDVYRLAEGLLAEYPAIHVLVNNAGALFASRETTPEGIERTWALNVVTPFLLTHLLLPRLESSKPARVVNVASAAHRGVHLNFEDLQGRAHYSGYGAYARSKLAVLLMTYEFARQLTEVPVTVNALHPGFVRTGFGRNNRGLYGATVSTLSFLFGIRPARGARTSIFLATDPSVAEVTGKYFIRRRPRPSSRASYDTAAATRLWDVLSLQTGIPSDVLSRVA